MRIRLPLLISQKIEAPGCSWLASGFRPQISQEIRPPKTVRQIGPRRCPRGQNPFLEPSRQVRVFSVHYKIRKHKYGGLAPLGLGIRHWAWAHGPPDTLSEPRFPYCNKFKQKRAREIMFSWRFPGVFPRGFPWGFPGGVRGVPGVSGSFCNAKSPVWRRFPLQPLSPFKILKG